MLGIQRYVSINPTFVDQREGKVCIQYVYVSLTLTHLNVNRSWSDLLSCGSTALPKNMYGVDVLFEFRIGSSATALTHSFSLNSYRYEAKTNQQMWPIRVPTRLF